MDQLKASIDRLITTRQQLIDSGGERGISLGTLLNGQTREYLLTAKTERLVKALQEAKASVNDHLRRLREVTGFAFYVSMDDQYYNVRIEAWNAPGGMVMHWSDKEAKLVSAPLNPPIYRYFSTPFQSETVLIRADFEQSDSPVEIFDDRRKGWHPSRYTVRNVNHEPIHAMRCVLSDLESCAEKSPEIIDQIEEAVAAMAETPF